MPGASALLEMTTAMRAPGIRPASMLSAIATKFEPRPERRMPRDFIAGFGVWISDYRSKNRGAPPVIHNCQPESERQSAVYNLALALHNAAHRVSFFAHFIKHRLRLL